MELLFIKQDQSEWDYIWLWLELHPINQGLDDPRSANNNGIVWEYMGSYHNNNKVIHEFVHKNHPKTNKSYVATLEASETFNDNQIEKRIKIK